MDLLKQVDKIMAQIKRKMNMIAYEEFKNKNGDKATAIKRSLQKLKEMVENEKIVKNKLKKLITYKHKKGW